MEDHMAMCRLEEVACEFTGVGCDRKLKREEQEEHTRQNTHKHLTITAAAAVKMKEQLLQKIEEQEQKIQQQILKLDKQEKRIQQQELKLDKQEQKLEKQEQKNQQQELKLDKQEQKLEKQEQNNQQQELKLDKQEQKLEKQEQKNQQQELKLDKQEQIIKLQEKKIEQLLKESDQNKMTLEGVIKCVDLKRTFEMENFSKEKAKNKLDDWKSPAMYTHVGGYKFCIGIDANGCGDGRGKALFVYLCAMPGEYDHQLKWPVEATLTIELLHQQGGHNVQHTTTKGWREPRGPWIVGGFGDIEYGMFPHFIAHYRLSSFLRNDALYFRITKITI